METIENLEDRSRLLEIAGVRGKTLLDIGVGPLAMIAVTNFGCRVTSIDVSDEALRKAREEAEKEGIRINFEREDAINLSYEDSSFEVVISYGALHHVSSLQARQNFIREACRVASEKVIIADFNEAGFPHTAVEYEVVDFDWLEEELGTLLEIKKYVGAQMNLYVCSRRGHG